MLYEFLYLMKDFAVINDFMKLCQRWARSSFLGESAYRQLSEHSSNASTPSEDTLAPKLQNQ